jgi:hypothetical protein
MPPNPHAFGIYLELILVLETTVERFDECKCENDDVHFFSNFRSLVMEIIVGSRV